MNYRRGVSLIGFNEGGGFPAVFHLLKRDREGIRLLQVVQQIARPDHYLGIRIRRQIVGYPNVKLFEADESGRRAGEERLGVDAADSGLDVLGHAVAWIPVSVHRASQS